MGMISNPRSQVGRKIESSCQQIISAIFIFLTPPSTVNSQQSSVNSHQSTVNSQQSTVNSQQSTVNSHQSTVNNDSGATGIDITSSESESLAELPSSFFLNYTFPNKFEPPYPPDFAANNPQKVPPLA